ncbi:MAG: rRNA maturation RNase YbeY [Chloroflexi bacterium RBG_13_48_10]|nr:MAG: rRNA maturation RNase YbeY [Chloroflexi bacterium RBG_13_48_10]
MINLHMKRSVKLPVDKSIILHAAQLTLAEEKVATGSDISIVIGDDAFLKKLNRRYRNLNETTDVLSFPSHELDPDTKTLYLGDVVISLPKAEEQAMVGGHPLVDELSLLVVHGTLHLLGYDHLKKAEKKKMQASQDKVLNQLGIKLVYNL